MIKLMTEYRVDEIHFPDGLIIKKSIHLAAPAGDETLIMGKPERPMTVDEELFGAPLEKKAE